MTTYKIFQVDADDTPYGEAVVTLVDPKDLDVEAHNEMVKRFGESVAYEILRVDAAGELKSVPSVPDDNCANGHPKAEWWTVTAGGRKYCRKCAVAASKKAKAKKIENIAGAQLEAAGLVKKA